MKINIYQICYSTDLLDNVPENFLILDNSKNIRPDWREYWPIRNFLIENSLEDNQLYGFFSPKFGLKTGLNHSDISSFINKFYNGEDLISFSPFWDLGSFFTNSIEQGNFFQPGLLDTFIQFIRSINAPTETTSKLASVERTVFCNYFIATKNFWLKWLEIGEILYNIGENNIGEASQLLNKNTLYGNSNIPMKIFIQERLTDYILLSDMSLKVLPFDSFKLPTSATIFNEYKDELVICNSLKQSATLSGNRVYYEKFFEKRNEIVTDILSKNPYLKDRFVTTMRCI